MSPPCARPPPSCSTWWHAGSSRSRSVPPMRSRTPPSPIATSKRARSRGRYCCCHSGRSPCRLEIERFGDIGDLGALAGHDLAKFLRAAPRRGLRGGVELGVGLLVVRHRHDVGTDLLTKLC